MSDTHKKMLSWLAIAMIVSALMILAMRTMPTIEPPSDDDDSGDTKTDPQEMGALIIETPVMSMYLSTPETSQNCSQRLLQGNLEVSNV